LENLEKQGLFDEETLILITPDHPSYSNTPTNALFKPFRAEFDNLPFIIVTKTKITAPVTDNPLVSQLDIAPTVLDLLNIPQPRGFFGHSLFDTTAQRSVFDIKEDYAVITTDEGKQVVPLNSRKQEDKPLLDLMRTFITD
jgi:arylsulfatase A-like enzyme